MKSLLLIPTTLLIPLIASTFFWRIDTIAPLEPYVADGQYTSPAIHAGNAHLLNRQQKDMIERFSSGEVRQACFAPGTSTVFIEAMDAATQHAQTLKAASIRAPGEAFFSQRWGSTATDGFNVGSTGDPIQLTWTVVPDGTEISDSGDNAHNAPSDLQARLDVIYPAGASEWLPIFQAVFDDWEAKTGIDYTYVSYDDLAVMGNTGASPGILNIRADVRIGGHDIDGDAGTLAYNYFPSVGDMVIDTNDSFFANTGSSTNAQGPSVSSVRLYNTISHEHGHGLGLDHVCPVSATKVMEPTLNIAFAGAQHDDVRGVHEGYGDKNGANNSIATATALTILNGVLLQETGMSIDKSSEVDYYAITPSVIGVLQVTAKPVGESYLHGAASGVSCPNDVFINSQAVHNLVITVYDTDGTTILRTVDNAAAGSNEIASTVPLNAAGSTYYIAISSSAGSSEAQLYDLDILLDSGVLSLGVSSTDTGVSFATANISGALVKKYNASTQTYESVSTLDSQSGYFVNFITPFAPSFTGSSAVPPIRFTLESGWNLLSIPSANGANWNTALITATKGGETKNIADAAIAGWVHNYAWVYDESTSDYKAVYDVGVLQNGVSVITAGENFWFKALVSGVILEFSTSSLPIYVGYSDE